MKKAIKLACAAFIGLSSIALTSCLGNNNNDAGVTYLTKDQKHSAIMQATGSYSGKFKGYTASYKIDSVATSIKVAMESDTTAMMRVNVPAQLVASYAQSDSNLVKQAGEMETAVRAYIISPLSTDYFEKNLYFYMMVPQADPTATVDGHKITVHLKSNGTLNFANNYYMSQLTYYNKKAEGFLLVEKISIDDNNYDVGRPLYFYVSQ